jgi:glycosyltransferase involved in cell wall biosynthesis
MSILFYDSKELNHKSILLSAIGASEYQYYNLVNEISKYKKTICFNNDVTKDNYKIIDNITYKSVKNFLDYDLDKEDIIIIQRFLPKDNETLNKIKNNKIYLWIHDDFNNKKFLTDEDDYISFFKNIIINNRNINFVFVSEDCKKTFIEFNTKIDHELFIEDNRLHVIYNILYEQQFIEVKNKDNIIINKNHIVYASAWAKGIEHIIKLFEYINSKNLDFKLVLLSPGYDKDYTNTMTPQIIDKFKDNVIIHGPKSKDEYCDIIKSSLCVISTKFKETFGCVFAESYYLATPVIADHKSGAVKEIIDNNFIVNIDNKEEVLQKILFIQENRDNLNIKLDDKFMLEYNLNLWKKLLSL